MLTKVLQKNGVIIEATDPASGIPDGGVSGPQHQEPPPEAADLHGVRYRPRLELDADHHADPPHLADQRPTSLHGPQAVQDERTDRVGVRREASLDQIDRCEGGGAGHGVTPVR